MTNLLTLTQAAQLLTERGKPVSADRLRRLCALNELKAQKFGKTWLLTEKEALKYQRQKAGRKRMVKKTD